MSHNNRERSETRRDRIAKAAAQAVFEAMETRRLMSAVTLTDGVLTLRADASTAANLVVEFQGPKGTLRAAAGDVEQSVAAETVTAIHMIGGDGDDSIYVDPRIQLPATIMAGAGDDVIRGGYGSDAVDAGAGDDVVYGGRGLDRIYGGGGNDTIHGNPGADVLDGGDGDDRILGGDSDDAVYGGEGLDTLNGGDGDDVLHGGDDFDRLAGDGGDDTLYGGGGNDRLDGDEGGDELIGGDGDDRLSGGRGTDAKSRDGDNGANAAGGSVNIPGHGGNDPGPGNNPNPDPAQTPKAVIRVLGRDVTVGQGVHVHGLDSTLNGGSYITARYEWDFGDRNGRYNKLAGFNAAHVYDEPGVYTITLTLRNELGGVDTETVQVTVAAHARRTIYVDNSKGRDTNSGASPTAAVRTAKRAFELVGDDTRILFKRGQKFSVSKDLDITSDRVLVGAYGTGDLPTLYRVEGGDGTMIEVSDEAENVTVENLAFDSGGGVDDDESAPKLGVTALRVGGVNIVARDLEFRNVDNGINSNGDPTGLLVMDTAATESYGLRAYHIWGEGTDHVYLGNTSPNSTREHNIRTSGVERILVAYNDLRNRDRTDDDRNDSSKGCIEIHKGRFSYVANNTVHDGVIRFGPLGENHEDPSTATDWNVCENNRLDDVGIQLYAGTHHTMIRNNVIERYESVRHSAAIQINAPDSAGRTSGDVYVLNNTAVDTRDYGAFLRLRGEADGVTVRNNLWVYDKLRIGSNGSAAIYVPDDDLGDFREISGNVWPVPASAAKWAAGGGPNFVCEEWGEEGSYLTQEDWNACEQVGTDFFQNVEPQDVYQVKLGDIVAGSSLPKAA